MVKKTSWLALGLTVVLGLAAARPAGAVLFTGLGDLPGGNPTSRAYGVSADGLVAVGRSGSAAASLFGNEAFRWTQAGGIVGLGDLTGNGFDSEALGVSADGSVVGGEGNSASGGEAFRWTGGVMTGLGDLPGGFFSSRAYGVSADGSVVVGYSNAIGWEAFRWTQAGGMVGLGDLNPGPSGATYSRAHGVSADGSVVVGSARNLPSLSLPNEAFRWTQAGGMVGLGDLPGDIFKSEAFGVSADGSVVVGWSNSASGHEAFRWTQAGGMVGLGDLPGGGFDSEAYGASADGSVVVGKGTSALGGEAFIWDATNGMRNLRDVLVNDFGLGAELAGWRLREARSISADGLVIVGTGISGPGAPEQAWLVSLRPNSTQSNPMLPTETKSGLFIFTDVRSGAWYDPPTVFGFQYVMTSPGSQFISILDFPTGFASPFTVSTGGQILGSFGPGQSANFLALLGRGVSEFTITGINPLVDPSDPRAFPLQLEFNAPTASFEMRAQQQQAIPEPGTVTLLLIGLAGLAAAWRKRCKA